jgi:hypothetical protein
MQGPPSQRRSFLSLTIHFCASTKKSIAVDAG